MSQANTPGMRRQFKGYDQNELQYRLMVNDLKIKIEKEKLLQTVYNGEREADNSVSTWGGRIETMMQYGEIAFISYRTVKNIVSFFKSFKKKR